MTRPSTPIVTLVVAVADNGVIGRENALPWHLPEDLKRFKRITMGKPIVMGRKTFESIGRLLPNRTTVVLTRRPDYVVPGAIVASSLTDAINAAARDDEIFVIGGAEVFREALPIADCLHLTTVDAEPAGDTHMPSFDVAHWREEVSEGHPADDRHVHAYRYQRLLRSHTPRDGG